MLDGLWMRHGRVCASNVGVALEEIETAMKFCLPAGR